MAVDPVFLTLLNNTGAIYRRQRVPDSQGGWPVSFVLNGLVDCRIRPASSAERTVAQQEERHITHVLYVEHGTDIKRGDRFTVQDLVVDVDGIREPSKADEHLEIDCLERVGETSELGYESPVTYSWLLENGSIWLLESGAQVLLEN